MRVPRSRPSRDVAWLGQFLLAWQVLVFASALPIRAQDRIPARKLVGESGRVSPSQSPGPQSPGYTSAPHSWTRGLPSTTYHRPRSYVGWKASTGVPNRSAASLSGIRRGARADVASAEGLVAREDRAKKASKLSDQASGGWSSQEVRQAAFQSQSANPLPDIPPLPESQPDRSREGKSQESTGSRGGPIAANFGGEETSPPDAYPDEAYPAGPNLGGQPAVNSLSDTGDRLRDGAQAGNSDARRSVTSEYFAAEAVDSIGQVRPASGQISGGPVVPPGYGVPPDSRQAVGSSTEYAASTSDASDGKLREIQRRRDAAGQAGRIDPRQIASGPPFVSPPTGRYLTSPYRGPRRPNPREVGAQFAGVNASGSQHGGTRYPGGASAWPINSVYGYAGRRTWNPAGNGTPAKTVGFAANSPANQAGAGAGAGSQQSAASGGSRRQPPVGSQAAYQQPGVYPTAYQCTPPNPTYDIPPTANSYGMPNYNAVPPTGLYAPDNVGFTPLFTLGQERNSALLGRGIIGQPTAYVPGQPVRNFMRYLFP